MAPLANSKLQDATERLQAIRNTISEQFDIEILLKHRELGNIEKEIAKTQVAIEQLRRCTLIPYADSTEAQLLAQLNYKPPSSNPHHIPDYAPPPEGVVDGPYTRHYRTWLIPHQRFDGPNAPSYSQAPPTPSLDLYGLQQSLLDSGRPQRASVLKAQTKSGVQVCLFRKKDGTLVRCVTPNSFCAPKGNIDIDIFKVGM
jgi:ADA HAT complex component 1